MGQGVPFRRTLGLRYRRIGGLSDSLITGFSEVAGVRTSFRRLASYLAVERVARFGTEAGGEEEVLKGGPGPQRRSCARARRQANYRVRHLGRSRGGARVHRPRNTGVTSGPLRGPRRRGVGSQARSFSGVSFFRNVRFFSMGCFHYRTDHGMFPSHRATSSGKRQFVITSRFKVLLWASMFHVSVLSARRESWICNATPLRLAE
jgi:hypothetical protein